MERVRRETPQAEAGPGSAKPMGGGVTRDWEAGSQMDWRGGLLAAPAADDAAALPARHELFATGTGALLSLGRMLNRAGGRRTRLHVPSFFCMEVVGNLQKTFDIRWYRDLPTEPAPDFTAIDVDQGDAVLAVNTFGMRDGAPWHAFARRHDRVTLIEDHTHDPFSPWASASRADYAITSLRKTLPLPDGAVVWSTKDLELPRPQASSSQAAWVKLTGMVLKRAYLDGADFPKDMYRRMEIGSEDELARDEGFAVSRFTSGVLGLLRIGAFRDRRTANFKTFATLAAARAAPGWRLLFDRLPEGVAPFGVILLCQDGRTRDALRRQLIARNVFTAVHWSQSESDAVGARDGQAIDISGRILTIPCDQRYDAADMERIAERVASALTEPVEEMN
jgi:hypothetical protein